MRKSIILFLAIMMFNFGFSRAVNTTAKVDKSIPSKLKLMEDPEEGSLLPSQFKPGKPTIHSSRNEFSSILSSIHHCAFVLIHTGILSGSQFSFSNL